MNRTRHREGGLVRAHRAGREGMSEMGRKGGPASLSIDGDSPEARSLRASDISRMRRLSEAQRHRLLRSREASFGLPPGTLTGAAAGARHECDK